MKQRLVRLYVARRLPRSLPARGRIAAVAASRPARWCYGRLPRRRRSQANGTRTGAGPTVH